MKFLKIADMVMSKLIQNSKKIILLWKHRKKNLFNKEFQKKIFDSRLGLQLIGAVAAQEKKQLKGLDQLEKRLLRAEKRRLKDILGRMTAIQDELFPNGSLQERQLNFSEVYLEMGDALIPFLMDALDPLDLNFSILTIQD